MNIRSIILVAGHGLAADGKTKDNGASGNGTTERAEVVQIAQEAIALIQRQRLLSDLHLFSVGVYEDQTLLQKISEVNKFCARYNYAPDDVLLVSIHINSGGGNRIEGWYKDGSEPGQKFAAALSKHMAKETGIPDSGTKPDTQNRHGRLGIVRDVKVNTAALIECGFIDTISNAEKLKDPVQDDAFAKAIVLGICDVLNVRFVENPGIYTDVEPGRWSEEAIKKMKDKGWMNGYPDGSFRPTQPVSREELAAVLARVLP